LFRSVKIVAQPCGVLMGVRCRCWTIQIAYGAGVLCPTAIWPRVAMTVLSGFGLEIQHVWRALLQDKHMLRLDDILKIMRITVVVHSCDEVFIFSTL
jgi:hypothetical protein